MAADDCTCRQPNYPGAVHRIGFPCYIPEVPEKPFKTRERLTPEQLLELKYRLTRDRTNVLMRGHSWDVADVLAVVESFDADISS